MAHAWTHIEEVFARTFWKQKEAEFRQILPAAIFRPIFLPFAGPCWWYFWFQMLQFYIWHSILLVVEPERTVIVRSGLVKKNQARQHCFDSKRIVTKQSCATFALLFVPLFKTWEYDLSIPRAPRAMHTTDSYDDFDHSSRILVYVILNPKFCIHTRQGD